MKLCGSAPAGVALLVAASCGGTAEPRVDITGVTPSLAYNDDKVDLVIFGGPFRPVYNVDTGAGRATTDLGDYTAFLIPDPLPPLGRRIPLENLVWRSTSELAATLRELLAEGKYDVEIHDPRGRTAMRLNAFTSLGPDDDLPTLTVLQPTSGAIVTADAEVPVAIHAEDGDGWLYAVRWTVSAGDTLTTAGACPVDPNAHDTTCRFSFLAPRPREAVQPVNINLEVEDRAHNLTKAVTTVAVGYPPVVTTLVALEGPASGGTDVTITGAKLITGSQLLVGGQLLLPNGGSLVDGASLRGRTPAHDPGPFPLTVRTGGAEAAAGTFTFVARPLVRAVSPVVGNPLGGTPVVIAGDDFRDGTTQVLFGPSRTPLSCLDVVSPHRITGLTPPGLGAVSVYVSDDVGGESELLDAFSYGGGADADPDADLAGMGTLSCPGILFDGGLGAAP
jgi:hypothetical protein